MECIRAPHKSITIEGRYTLFQNSTYQTLSLSSRRHSSTGVGKHSQPERGWTETESHTYHQKKVEGETMKTKDHHLMNRKGVYYLQADGIKKSLKTRDKAEARRRRDELLKEMFLNNGKLIEPEPEPEVPVLGQVAVEWFERKKKTCRHWTLNSYKSKLNAHLLKAPLKAPFINTPVDQINDDMIEAWISDKPQIRATSDLMVVVSMIFKFAVKRRYIRENPTLMVDRPKYIKKMPDPYTKDEMNKIILGIDSHYQDYIEFKFLTGISSAEVHGLLKENLDFDSRLIHIRQTCVNGVMGAPKNAFRMRSIRMNKRVLALLEHQISKHSLDYVFVNKHNRPINSKNFARSTWKPLLKKLKIRYRRAYNTRHTFISMALKAGERVDFVARFVGHSSTKMIYECYQGYIPDTDDGKRFEDYITPILPQAVKDENPPFSMCEYLLKKSDKKSKKALT